LPIFDFFEGELVLIERALRFYAEAQTDKKRTKC
jgi:hypothetical protein